MGVTPITSLDQFKQLINGEQPVIIDFWATWCGPCRQISPMFEKHSTATESVGFYKVDVDERPDIAHEVGVRSMPTFNSFHKGQKIGEIIGAYPTKLEDLVKTTAAAAATTAAAPAPADAAPAPSEAAPATTATTPASASADATTAAAETTPTPTDAPATTTSAATTTTEATPATAAP